MTGRKERAFGPLPAVTLEVLGPQDRFSRHLERTHDLRQTRACRVQGDAMAASATAWASTIAASRVRA